MATILIIDDRTVCREFLTTLLGYDHHHLLEARDGIEALNIINTVRPDLIISDLLMPTMNGYEFVQKIKSDPSLATIPVIFYTASFLLEEAKLLAETCEVKYVLYKPSEPQLILDTVNHALASATYNISTIQNNVSKLSTPHPDAVSAADESGIAENQASLAAYLSKIKDSHTELQPAIIESKHTRKKDERLTKICDSLTSTFLRLNKISNQMAAMSELTLHMLSLRDPRHLLRSFAKEARKIINCKYCFVGILDQRNTKLKRSAISGADKSKQHEIKILQPDYISIQLTLNTNHCLALNNFHQQSQAKLPANHPDINHFLSARLITSTHLYGYLYFIDKNDGTEFDDVDNQIVTTMAAEIAMLYENAELYETIQRHAVRLQLSMHARETEHKKPTSTHHR